MMLIIKLSNFKKLQDLMTNSFLSTIDFEQQEWQFTILTNQEIDVEIRYLFQFDHLNAHQIEIYCNGMDDDILRYDILNRIQSAIPEIIFDFQ
ncbi:hypothetical protein [Moraxella pluranimalium]|uniref:Uncharacterized protein n=1 Tax=Moraxella pluranimalium TaxID=470453 RepID=A0A1T0CT26_9GAMM|nr:hypothetical protein [Moraxella pluranimalium]OOS25496.1 hypothetical protein B0680_01285 [Moraxella pluranimalium]